MRVFFVFDCFAAGVDPEDGDHAVLVGCVDELGGFGEHVGFVFAAEVDGVADSSNFDSAVGEVGDLVNGPELGADGVFLGDADKVGFGVHFDEVGYLGVVHGVAGDEAELGGKDADLGFGCDAEEVFRVAVVGGDACAAEVVVEVFDLLVTGCSFRYSVPAYTRERQAVPSHQSWCISWRGRGLRVTSTSTLSTNSLMSMDYSVCLQNLLLVYNVSLLFIYL